MRRLLFVLSLTVLSPLPRVYADGCITQAAMPAATRTAIAQAALGFSRQVQNAESSAIRANTIPAYSGENFSGIQEAIGEASPNIKGATFHVQSVWLLDASNLKPSPDGTLQDGQFFCTLHGAISEVSFVIPSLPQGRYALAIVDSVSEKNPWQLSFMMQEIAGGWRLAGFFPHALTAGGHDGLWYWRAARDFTAKKQPWNAWLYYKQTVALLRPVTFMSSTHLDKLSDEMNKAAPHAIAQGISAQSPLALKNADGSDLFITALGTDTSLGTSPIDLAMHIRVDAPVSDPVAGRARNRVAAATLLRSYPELRSAFHGVWIFADAPGASPFATEEPMTNLPPQ